MTVIDVDSVTVEARARKLLDGFTLRVQSGDVVALLGPNGAGKTTLLRCILGLIRPTLGRIALLGIDNAKYTAKRRATLVAHLSQHTGIDEALTVLDYVATARYCHDEHRATSERAAHEALLRVGADGLANRRLGPLSGGERQRVALAALLAQGAPILLLDEPANHLDPARQAQTYALLGELQRARATMILVTHDINLLGLLYKPEHIRVVGMQDGRLAFEQPYAAERLELELSALYGVAMHRLEDHGRTLLIPSMPVVP